MIGDGQMLTRLMKNDVVKNTLWTDNRSHYTANTHVDRLSYTGRAILQLNLGDHVYIKTVHDLRQISIISNLGLALGTFSGVMIN